MSVKNVRIEVMEVEDDGQEARVLGLLGPQKLAAFEMMATAILITDGEGVVHFMNPAANALLSESEPYLQTLIRGFSVESLVGRSLQILNTEDVAEADFRKKMGDPKGTILNIGEISFGLRLSALRDQGTAVGFMCELWDATPEIAIKDQVNALLADLGSMARRHTVGEISAFPDPERYEGTLRKVAEEISDMVRSHIHIRDQIIQALRNFGQGDFSKGFPALPGEQAVVSDAINSVRKNFRAMIAEIARITSTISDGNLDVTIKAEDFAGEFGTAVVNFEGMLDTLNGIFTALGVQVSQSAAAVEQMSSAAKELAGNSQIQSSSVDEVSASAEETDTQVKANAAAAGQANQLVTGAATVAQEGKEKIGQMVQAMEGIRASSQDIAKIIKVIDEIAFQTNLLALNAAVEAARAGQHGRGFAVVAQEVRNLAGRSAKAARETGELIESAGARVQAGVKIADETSRAFASIAGDIEQVRSFMREIAVASDEQARGVAQINNAIGEVAKTALVTSQQADEVADLVNDLEQATANMRKEVSRFTLRPAASAPSAMPDLNSLPPEIAAQVLALIKKPSATAAPANKTTLRSTDRDERGFKGF